MKVIISGGGTGGHIFPAVAIANEIKRREPGAEILFVGAEGRMEMEKVPKAGYNIVGLPVQGFQRRLTFKNLVFFFKLFASLNKAGKIVKDFAPDIVVGTGGFASGPVIYKATKKGIPALIQEQNSLPGVTNKILGKKVQKVCVAYEEAKKYFPADKVVLTGNPIRREIINLPVGKEKENKEYFGFNPGKPLLLVVGGSLGALAINRAIHSAVDKFVDAGIQVLWQTGVSYYEKVENKEELKKQGIVTEKFIYEMDKAYSAADYIVSRAGAMSISELAVVGKPAVLVPSPYVAENHQYKNAMALVSRGAALLVENDKAVEELASVVISLNSDKELQHSLAENIKQFAKPDATERITDEIFKLIK